MNQVLVRAYLHEILRQAKFVDIAAGDLTEWTQQKNLDIEGAIDRVWYSVQALLTALANLSKLLWGDSEPGWKGDRYDAPRTVVSETEVVRAYVRGLAGVSDTSPLNSRAFRNIWEHFGRELETWALNTSRPGLLGDSNLGPVDRFLGVDPRNLLRNLDHDCWVLTFRGRSYELVPPLEANKQLFDRLSELLSKPPEHGGDY